MSQNEEPLIDKQGKFLQVVKRGRKRTDVGWIPGRILLSEKRLVLAASEGKRTVPVKDITEIGSRFDVNQNVARVAEYTAVRYDDDDNVLLITASSDPEEIEQGFYQALLDSESVLIRHPAVEGGVVQDTDWCRGQLKYDDDSVVFGLSNGTFAEIELDDIGGFNTAKQMVQEEHRTVLKVEHTREEGISIQTHVTGTGQHVQVLTSLFREGHQRSEIGVELEQHEQQVLMALYTGVSPFDIPEFVGMDVDQVEEIYARLIDLDALDKVRMRREVELTARGRQIASGAMDNE